MRNYTLLLGALLVSTSYGASRRRTRGEMKEPLLLPPKGTAPLGFKHVTFKNGWFYGGTWNVEPLKANSLDDGYFSMYWQHVLPSIVSEMTQPDLQGASEDQILGALFDVLYSYRVMESNGGLNSYEGYVNVEKGLYITKDAANRQRPDKCDINKRSQKCEVYVFQVGRGSLGGLQAKTPTDLVAGRGTYFFDREVAL